MFYKHLTLPKFSMFYKQQLISNNKKRLLSAHRWASVNHTFSTSIHIDFFFLFSWINELSRVNAYSRMRSLNIMISIFNKLLELQEAAQNMYIHLISIAFVALFISWNFYFIIIILTRDVDNYHQGPQFHNLFRLFKLSSQIVSLQKHN